MSLARGSAIVVRLSTREGLEGLEQLAGRARRQREGSTSICSCAMTALRRPWRKSRTAAWECEKVSKGPCSRSVAVASTSWSSHRRTATVCLGLAGGPHRLVVAPVVHFDHVRTPVREGRGEDLACGAKTQESFKDLVARYLRSQRTHPPTGWFVRDVGGARGPWKLKAREMFPAFEIPHAHRPASLVRT